MNRDSRWGLNTKSGEKRFDKAKDESEKMILLSEIHDKLAQIDGLVKQHLDELSGHVLAQSPV